MLEIGGYLDFSANWQIKEFAYSPILLNTARNCIRYITQQRKIQRILVPYYSCHTVVRALQYDGVEVVFYSLDEEFMPVFSKGSQDEYFIYVNYYGVMDEKVNKLSKKYCNLIVDNSQAYFSIPQQGVDTVSSPRKFFGLPDGGLLFPGKMLKKRELPLDTSSGRVLYLAKRLDYGAKKVYSDSLEVRKSLENSPIKRMSKITQLLLSSLDLEYARKRRIKNWYIIDEELGETNRFKVKLCKGSVPLFYPYYCSKPQLRSYLVSNNIFVGTYWPDVLELVSSNSFEASLVMNMIPLPIDQRYDVRHMKYMIDIINNL